MRKLLRWGLAALVVLVAAGVVAWQLRPEGYTVNLARGGADKARLPEEAFLTRLKPAEGFHLTRFASDVRNARFMRVTAAGDVIVSQPRESQVLLLHRDADGDGRADGRTVLLGSLNRPHGLALRADEGGSWLYVAESDAIGRVRFDGKARTVSGAFERLVRGLPGGGNHWTRTIGFGPDGGLFLSLGSSCNVCDETDPRRAAITRYEPDGTNETVYAKGLRNAVGFAWSPAGELFATDNGRDLLGDDFPPCELNRVEKGADYGWPHANGAKIPDPDFGAANAAKVAASVGPIHEFPAHNAPLGIAFLEGDVPPAYRGAAIVALHGSWNRNAKDGYKVVSLHWSGPRIEQRDFLAGFLSRAPDGSEDVIGRPVDVAQGPDGAVYVSDDFTGAVYRLSTRAARGAASAESVSAPGSEPPVPGRVDPARMKLGAEVFALNRCETCHDPRLTPPPGQTIKPLLRLAERYSEVSLVRYLEAPQPPMPLFEMSDSERRALAAYLLATYRE